MKIDEILTPALILEQSAFNENLKLMNEIVKNTKIDVRPHYKSHKSIKIAKMQMDMGAKGISCAKLGEAEDLVEAGFKDILIANQITRIDKIKKLAELCKKSFITVCVDSAENIRNLNEEAKKADVKINIFVEFNIGQNRCGVNTFEEVFYLARLAESLENLTFGGIEAYAGHIAHEYSYEKRLAATEKIEKDLKALKSYVEEKGIKVKEISGISTGTIRFRENSESVYTETQPGSYIFMDSAYTPVKVGFKNSLFILATVVSVKPHIVVTDAGLKTASTDMGEPMLLGFEDVKSLMSEEHISHNIKNHGFNVNDLVRYIPSHCCTTVNLFDEIYLVNKEEVIDIIKIDSRGKSY